MGDNYNVGWGRALAAILAAGVTAVVAVTITATVLKLRDSAGDNTIAFSGGADEKADRTITIPPLGGNKYLPPTSQSDGTISTTEIKDGTIADDDVSGTAAIAGSKIQAVAVGANAGVVPSTGVADAHVAADAAIADTKLGTIATAGKVSDSALSANVPLKNAVNAFTGANTFGAAQRALRVLGLSTAASTMSTVACATNVVTVGTTTAHGLIAGQTVTVNAIDNTYDATALVVAVPTTTSFTYALTHGDEGEKADAGSVTPLVDLKLGAAPVTPNTDSDVVITSTAATQVPLVVQGAAAQSDNLQEWQDSAGTNMMYVTPGGTVVGTSFSGPIYSTYWGGLGAAILATSGGVFTTFGYLNDTSWHLSATGQYGWGTNGYDANDTGLVRAGAAAVVKVTNGSTGAGDLAVSRSVLTVAVPGMVLAANAYARKAITKATWTNVMVTDLGAVLAGDVQVCTLPAKTTVTNAYVVIDTQAAGTTTLTVALGRTGAGYIDYVVASDAKAAANTVYGDAVGERGTNLTGYDLPSYTGTTAIYCHFISTVENLDQVTTCTGTVILETETLP